MIILITSRDREACQQAQPFSYLRRGISEGGRMLRLETLVELTHCKLDAHEAGAAPISLRLIEETHINSNETYIMYLVLNVYIVITAHMPPESSLPCLCQAVALPLLEYAYSRLPVPGLCRGLLLPSSRFIKGGVQWKQGVMIYMMLYTSVLYDTTPIR